MRFHRTTTTALALTAAAVLVAFTASCGASLQHAATATATTPPSPPPAVPIAAGAPQAGQDPSCKASKFQPREDPNGPSIKAIQARGYVNIGVDFNDYHWGFRGADGQPAGFDIDLARTIAQSLPGNPKINWIALDDDQRIPRLNATGDQHVDFVVHTMTINCQRRQQVDMSTVYFEAGQRVLIPSARAHQGESGPDAMKGQRVCVAGNSTASQLLQADGQLPKDQQKYQVAAMVSADSELDCLVRLQLGQTDALLTDDAIAYGLAAQDPSTMVVGDQLTDEPYGVATGANEDDLASWINKVLEDYRSGGGWRASYDHWIKPYVPGGQGEAPPPAQYTD